MKDDQKTTADKQQVPVKRSEVKAAMTFTLTLSKDPSTPGKAVGDQPDTKGCFLKKGDTLNVKLDETSNNKFSANATFAKIEFFKRKNKDGADSFAVIETTPGQTKPVSCAGKKLFDVTTGPDARLLSITDDQAAQQDNEHIWYSISLDDAGDDYLFDPELLNTGTAEVRRGFEQLEAGDTDPTLP